MLQAIAILGGWLLMMGQHDRSESLFYYFRIEDQVPQNHLLRFIDRYGSFIMANASHHSRIPREQFTEAAQVNYGARKYLEELEQENGDGEPIHQQDKVSTTDPDSTYLTKGNRAAELGYFDNYLIDNESCVIVGVQATAARLSQESA